MTRGPNPIQELPVPTLETQIERGGPIACGVLALAAWARYLATVPQTLRAPDSQGERAAALAQDSLVQPAAFLDLDEVFTPSLRESARFRKAFAATAADLARLGPRGAIEQVAG
jgi:mannitol-1-phosphate/altronate dehydrogenase